MLNNQKDMIAVIADDFTGAAEIGGIGLKYGLDVIIETGVNNPADSDILIIATDTRSLPADIACSEIEIILSKLLKLKPEYIFKKLDSVLRGNIADELETQIKVTGKKRAIIIAANPALGRTIKNGKYLIDSVPLSETSFAYDPEFPITSSVVVDIIGGSGKKIVSRPVNGDLPETGLIAGDVTSQSEMDSWAGRIDDDTIAAGGSGFFDVLLSKKFRKQNPSTNEAICLGEKSLFVFGSLYPKSQEVIQRINGINATKINMPETIYRQKNFNPELMDSWVHEVVGCLEQNQKVIISIEHQNNDEPALPERIRENIGQLVSKVAGLVKLDDLLIEGGATTSTILKNLGITKLFPYKEIEFGIIQMKVDKFPGLCLTTKPGSYLWPESIRFENSETVI